MSKSPRVTPPDIAVTGHKRRKQITPAVPEELRIHKPRAIAPRPQLSLSQPLLRNKNITSSQWPVGPTCSYSSTLPRKWSERSPVPRVARGRVSKRTTQRSERKSRIDPVPAHIAQLSYAAGHRFCAETEAKRQGESSQLKPGKTTQESFLPRLYEQMQDLPKYQPPDVIDTLQDEDGNALPTSVNNNFLFLPLNEAQISEPLNNQMPNNYGNTTQSGVNSLPTQNSIPENFSFFTGKHSDLSENLRAEVIPPLQFMPSPAMGDQLALDLTTFHELAVTLPSLIQHQTSLPENVADPHRQHERKGSKGCGRCSGFWCTHSECIFRATIKTADQVVRDQLLESYSDLRLHIHEHIFGSREMCSLCENLFYSHILQLLLLFEVKEVGQVVLGIRNNLMNLRRHVEEAHGVFEHQECMGPEGVVDAGYGGV